MKTRPRNHTNILVIIWHVYALLVSFVNPKPELSHVHHLRLPKIQAEKLMSLFVEGNIGLQFDINQDDHTNAVLLSVEQSFPSEVLFQLTTSTIDNTIQLEFRARNNQHKLYKISAPLNDEVTVTDNCHQLLKTKDEDIDFGIPALQETRVYVGQQNSEGNGFQGRLREFTADAGNPIELKCPELELTLGNSVTTEFVDSSAAGTTFSSVLDPASTTVQTVIGGRMLADDSRREDWQLAQRLEYLEGHLKHWNSVFQKFDSRIKKVELHQRGCQIGGRILGFGERRQNMMNCTECQCSSSGYLHCNPIGCPRVDCAHPVNVAGKCCPECGKQCFYNGQNYQNGEEFWPKKCVRCKCENGIMECQFKHTQACPPLNCPDQDTPPNQCCPVCVNVDHCAGNNGCHRFAICESGQYGAKCTCKAGFFGNGTTCYDVDECLWDESAREQLGGCQLGTICINLPGNFKCDCLPGYQKLDDKNCLDVIRI
uniref:Uncharacterized protein n=1 Tax=Ditylenchus dipsaci TaxID=166011 RepID=A0A915DW00_9BILA